MIKRATKIMFGAKLKRLFVRCRLHYFVDPFVESLLKLAYLSKLSRWCAEQGVPAWNDSSDSAGVHGKRYGLYSYLMQSERLDGKIRFLEFGVGNGASFLWWVKNNTNPASRFIGFDTFEGLPEKWGYMDKGEFSTQGKPPSGCGRRSRFEVGLFQETLDGFLQSFHADCRTIIHLDADLYSSTLFVLSRIAPKLKPGDILLFDEFGVPTHEFKAFTDFAEAFKIQYKLLGAVNNYMPVALKVL